MGFFDFLFNKSNDESAVVEQTLSPIEQVVKESVEHLKKCLGTLTSEKLEAEAINLASYIFLRKNGKIKFELDFLTKGIMEKVPSGDYAVADKVFPLMVKYGEGLYTNLHADFGKNKGYKLNVTKDPDLASFLKGYYKSVHKVNVGETNPKPSTTNPINIQNDSVDLGLSSGILWATCNIGASSPSEIGEYFAWGEKETKDAYGWETYELCHGSYNSIFKYTEDDRKSILEPQDDVANSELGGEWRIPTKEDMEELVEECEWKWSNQNGRLGWKVIGPNNNYIFLPASGAASSYIIAGVNELGRYWTATRDKSNYSAYNLRFKDVTDTIVVVDDTRFYGRTIRPVLGQPVKRTVKNEEEEQEKLPYPLKKITLPTLLKNRMEPDPACATSYICELFGILEKDREYYDKFSSDDYVTIYNAVANIDALIPTQLGLSQNGTRNAIISRLAGLLAQSKCKKNNADYVDNDAKFYALGGEAMWKMVEWQYIMIYCNFHTDKEKSDFIELVSNAVEKAIIKMVTGSEYTQHEQQCMIDGAKSIMLDKMVGASVYGMFSEIFPTLF